MEGEDYGHDLEPLRGMEERNIVLWVSQQPSETGELLHNTASPPQTPMTLPSGTLSEPECCCLSAGPSRLRKLPKCESQLLLAWSCSSWSPDTTPMVALALDSSLLPSFSPTSLSR